MVAKTHKQECASMRSDGTSAHQHTGALVPQKFVSFAPSPLLPWIQCLYTFNISPDCQAAASSVLSAGPAETKEAESKAYGF